MRPHCRLAFGVALLLPVLTLGCNGDNLSAPATPTAGSLVITTASGGESLDPDGYAVTVDGRSAGTIESNGSTTIAGLAPGAHSVALTGVASNCTSEGGATQTVSVSAGHPPELRFSITCSYIGITMWNRIPLPPSVTAVITWGSGRTIWATSPADIFVITRTLEDSPRYGIWHYDGSAWTEQLGPMDTVLHGIWGSSGNDVYAVGDQAIWHYDGAAWAAMANSTPTPSSFAAVWGAASGKVFAAGADYSAPPATELVARFDGQAWSRLALPSFGDLTSFTGLGGTSAVDVWAIGSQATCGECDTPTAVIVHFDGSRWAEQFSENADDYFGIWAAAPNDVWVVGENDERNANVLHYDGTGWTRGEPLSTSENGLHDVWASSGTDVYAVGPRVLLHYNGSSWTKLSDGGGDGLWGVSRNDVFILRATEILHGSP